MSAIKQKSHVPFNKFIQTTLCTGLTALSLSSFAQTADFTVIDGFITEGRPFSEANGVSEDGSTVVGMSSTDDGIISAFRWVDGQTTNLGALPAVGPNSAGEGISGDGNVLVGRGRTVDENGAPINGAWWWTEENGIQDLGRPSTAALDASFDGSVIIGQAVSDNSGSFRWTAETGAELIPALVVSGETGTTTAYAISSNGEVIVGKSSQIPFRWTEATGTVSLGDFQGEAYDVTPDGRIIVGNGDFSGENAPFLNEAFRWTEDGGVVALGLIPGHSGYSRAKAISSNGSIIVGTSADSGLSEIKAFIWDASNGMRDLQTVLENEYNVDLGDLTLTSANGVSADGNIIVGRAEDSAGYPRAWLVNLNQISDPLEVSILSPGSGSSFFDSETIHLDGAANDLEEGDLSSTITWSSDVDGELGQSAQLAVNLSAGAHTVTAEVIDQTGDLAYTSVDLTVLETPSLSLSVEVKRFFFFFSYTVVSWSGATDSVEILKDGSVARTGGTSGEFTESGKGKTYQVCQINSDFCSESIVAN